HLALVVRVAVVLAGAVVMVALGARVVRGELLEPTGVVLVQPRLVVVDEHARGDVHRVDETEALANSTLGDGSFARERDVHEPHAPADVQRDDLAVGSHAQPFELRRAATSRPRRRTAMSARKQNIANGNSSGSSGYAARREPGGRSTICRAVGLIR